jgi:hypothetical protein
MQVEDRGKRLSEIQGTVRDYEEDVRGRQRERLSEIQGSSKDYEEDVRGRQRERWSKGKQ